MHPDSPSPQAVPPSEDQSALPDSSGLHASIAIGDLLLAFDAARAAGLPPPAIDSSASALSSSDDIRRRDQLALAQACLDRLHRRWPWPGDRPVDSSPTSPLADLKLKLGRYTLINLVGSGGHGLVFLASDPTLQRNVALKIPRPETLASDRHRQRFLREAHALGRLDHPGIIPIHDFGQSGPVCYLAMAYVDGFSLADWLASRREPVPPQTAASLVRSLADAVAHAHSRGVLHRDLKPGNVMLEWNEPGTVPVPRITDFGLAKLLDEARDENRAETLPLGTPRFMAPEQAAGDRGRIGPATDVYALGAILHAILTGAAPDGPIDTLHDSSIDRPHVPFPLRQIVARCLSRDPKNRYQSSEALVDDLQRFLAGHPVAAATRRGLLRPALTGLTSGRRWLAGIAIIVPLLLSSTLIVLLARRSLVLIHPNSLPRKVAISTADNAPKTTELELRYLHDIQRAFQLISRNHDVRTADAERLDHWRDRAQADGPDPRRFEWGYLKNLGHRESMTVRHRIRADGRPSEVYQARFSPDGNLLITAGQDGAARFWDAVTGKPVGKPLEHPSEVNWAAFSPDGKLAATACDDGMIRVWDVASRALKRQMLHAPGKQAVCVLFTPDSRRLISGARDHCLVIWDTKSGAELVRHDAKIGEIDCLAVASSGSLAVAGGGAAGKLAILNSHDGTLRWQNYRAPFGPRAVDLLSDGRSVATTSERAALVVDLEGKTAQRVLSDHRDQLFSVAFSPDGALLATGCHEGDPALRIWNLETGRIQEVLPGHAGRVWCLGFSPDGARLASASGDGSAKLWHLDRWADRRVISLPSRTEYVAFRAQFTQTSNNPRCASFSGLVFVSRDGRISATQSDGRDRGEPLFVLSGKIALAAISADGRRVAAILADSSLVIVNLSGNDRPHAFSVMRLIADPVVLAIDAKGMRIAVREKLTADVLVIDADSGQIERRFTRAALEFNSIGLQFFNDGRRMAGLEADGNRFAVFDLMSGVARINPEPRARGLNCLMAVSPDGTLMAIGDRADAIRVFDSSTLALKSTLVGSQDDVFALAFSPDGRRVASGDRAGVVKLWDVATGEELVELEGLVGAVHLLEFGPDGQNLVRATGENGGRVVVWHGCVRSVDGPTASAIRGAD